MRLAWKVGTVLLVAFGLAAGCSDEDDDDGSGSGGAAGAGTGGSAGGGAVALCDVTGDGVCQNETDCAFVLSGQLESAAYQCEDECVAEESPEECAVACIQMELGASEACSTCFAELAACADQSCFGACSADPESLGCRDCLEQYGCTSDVEACGGITLN